MKDNIRRVMGMNKSIFICFLVFLSATIAVSAVQVSVIQIDGCTIDDLTAGCAQTLTYSCNIAVISSDPDVIILSSLVKFTVNGQDYVPELTAGTAKNGTYELEYVVAKDDDLDFAKVSAESSDSEAGLCSAEYTSPTGANCKVSFDEQIVANECGCSETISYDCNTETCCNPTNKRRVTHNVEAGCSYKSYSVVERCDFCDPEWKGSYGPCTEGVDGNYFQTISYLAENTKCCSDTHDNSYYNHYGGTDCTPPPSQSILCSSYEWKTYQKNNYGEGYSQLAGISGGIFDVDDYNVFEFNITANPDLQPVSYDVTGDKKAEMFVFGTSAVHMIKPSGATYVLSSYNLGEPIVGQPGITGGKLYVPVANDVKVCSVSGNILSCASASLSLPDASFDLMCESATSEAYCYYYSVSTDSIITLNETGYVGDIVGFSGDYIESNLLKYQDRFYVLKNNSAGVYAVDQFGDSQYLTAAPVTKVYGAMIRGLVVYITYEAEDYVAIAKGSTIDWKEMLLGYDSVLTNPVFASECRGGFPGIGVIMSGYG
jgi:hypothetical protein